VVEQATVTAVGAGAAIVALEVRGDADLLLQAELHAAIGRALDQDCAVIVDLSDTTFIDLSIVHTLTRGYREAHTQGTGFVLQVGTADIVERVLELTGLLELIPRARTRETAAQLLTSPVALSAGEPPTGPVFAVGRYDPAAGTGTE
jgi:anti-anti-sigma factor